MSRKYSDRICTGIMIAAIIAGLFLRFYKLDLRPFHHDEGVNSSFLLILMRDGIYHYNPMNFHGPLLYYLSYIPLSIFGLESSLIRTENPDLADISFRLVPATFGLLIIVFLLSLKSWLGRTGTIASMILVALSPSYLYFSRDNIHEIYLMAFTLLTFICGYHFWKTSKILYLYLTFLNLALMFTLKETAIITGFIWALSLLATTFIHTIFDGGKRLLESGKELYREIIKNVLRPIPIAGIIISLFTLFTIFIAPGKLAEKAEESWYLALATKGISIITLFLLFSFLFKRLRDKRGHVLSGAIVFFIVIAVFFSSLFTYSKGVASFFIAFEKWFSAGTVESVHSKPFFYFLKIMFEFESPILFFGILGMLFSRRKNDPAITFTICWAILSFLMNSLIPYKTPWLVLNLLLPLILLAGKFIEDLISSLNSKLLLAAFLALSTLIIGRFAYTSIDLSFINYDNDKKEIVYVQTYRKAKELFRKTLELCKNFNGNKTKIHIIPSDLWPLPWYFRDLTGIMYNAMTDAPIIIINSDKEKELEGKLKKRYEKERYPLRPGVSLTLYYQNPKGKSFVDDFRFTKPVDLSQNRERLKPGLQAKVFHSANFTGNIIDEKVEGVINFRYDNEEEKPYKSPFSILWTGYIYAPISGDYSLITESDDGSWIYINNKLVLDNGGMHGIERVESEVYLKKGYHPIEVKYFDNYFGAIMRLKWKLPRGREELITGRFLYHLE